jgi:carboxyl-terminal processing protease
VNFIRRALCLLAAVWVAGVAVRADVQDWRAAGLAAFDTVWLTINETFYDPDFGGIDWAAVRAELRPLAARAPTVDDQRAVIRDMLGRLGQSHFALLTSAPDELAPAGPAGVPFDVRVTPAGVFVVTRVGAISTGVAPGDVILEIDGAPVADLIAGSARDPRHADIGRRRAMRALSGIEGEPVRLKVVSPAAEPRDVTVARVRLPGEIVTVGNLPPLRVHLEAEERATPMGRRVGVIAFNVWMAAVAEPFATAVDRFRGHDALVIDLRGNPGGLADMIRGIAGHVLAEPAVLGRMHMRGLDLEFRANPRRSTSDGRSVEPYAGPVAILVDGLTASASECFAGALQGIGRARVFGTKTSGQALPAVTQQLANGDVLVYAVGDFVTSAGRRLEGAGVEPDVEVPLDPARLAAGQDALAAALQWVDTRAVQSTAVVSR